VSRWTVKRLGELPRHGGWIPIRAELGFRPAGVNAWVGDAAGDEVIGEHDEREDGHEELYLVVEGHARFRVAGRDVDAPPGTLVAVAPDVRRSAVALEPGTTVLAIGARPGAAFTPSPWESRELAGQPDAGGEPA
jgi:hypothetical protein